MHDSRSFSSVGIGPDVASVTRTFVDMEIGPDVIVTPMANTTHTHESLSMQMTIDNSPPTISTQFSWADDAASIPITSLLLQKQTSRDFSALRSDSTKPFSTLQHRYQWSRGIQRTHQRARMFPVQQTYNSWPRKSPPLVTHYHLSGARPGRPAITTPIHSVSVSHLDWDQDPRLRELGRVLGTLGWVRQAQFF